MEAIAAAVYGSPQSDGAPSSVSTTRVSSFPVAVLSLSSSQLARQSIGAKTGILRSSVALRTNSLMMNFVCAEELYRNDFSHSSSGCCGDDK